MYSKTDTRFRIMMYDLAKALSRVTDAPWEKVKVIYFYCPQIGDDGHFVIQPYSLDSLTALGMYYLQSNFQHTDKIVPYLLNLLKDLTTAKWLHGSIISEVSFPEMFSFCLNTLLTEISVLINKDIFIYQNNEIENIIFSIVNDLNTGFNNEEKEIHFYSIKLPVFLGLAQSMVRYSSERSFFCYTFSKQNKSIGIFHHIKANYDCPHINLFPAICEEANKIVPKSCNHVFNRQYCGYPPASPLSVMKTLHTVLTDEILMLLERKLKDCKIQMHPMSQFYVKNLIEIFRYGMMLLYRDLLYQTLNLTDGFVQDQKDFLDRVYTSIKEYNSLNQSDFNVIENEEQTFQKLKIIAVTKVICVESLAWCVNDHSEAENLCLRIAPSLMEKQDDKVLFLNAPYIIACMDVLGMLAESIFSLADITIKPLQDFLSLPSPIITDLYRISSSMNKTDLLSFSEVSKIRMFEYCIFKRVQNSAIESTCKTLKSASLINSDYIQAFLTKFSSLLFMEKGHPHYLIITENVIVTLGHISYSMPSLSLTILQCFQQRLCKHSIESDIAIINQLGNMLIFNRKMEVFLGALKTFSNILLEVNNDSNSEFNCISSNLHYVLDNVSERLQDQPKIVAIFVRFLEIYVQTALDELRNPEIATAEKNKKVKDNRYNLLRMIALLGRKLEDTNQFKKQQERLFQDFWLYIIVSTESSFTESAQHVHIKRFAPKLPTLTSESLTDHDIREFSYTSSLNKIKISPQKLQELKTYINVFFQHVPDVTVLVNRLTLPQIIYLHSVCILETIRIENSEKPSAEPLFIYLTNLKLQKDKYGMWQCICKVAEVIFRKFLTIVSQMERNYMRDSILATHAKLLLIHFNNVNSQIRHIADKFLSELIDRFPHLLWNRQVLWSIVDILTVLYYSKTIDSNDQIMSIKVPNADYSIFLMETNKLRSEILNDFLARSRDIISEARKWQSPIVNAHLQEFILQDERSVIKDDFYKIRYFAWMALCSNENLNSVSRIITSLTVKSQYIGEISGIIESSGVNSADFCEKLVKNIWEACNKKDLEEYRMWLLRATAFVVTERSLKDHINLEIKLALTSSPVSLFTEDVMLTAIECWNWICVCNPHFETELLVEIFEAWQYSMKLRMGAFSSEAAFENNLYAKSSAYIDPEPHNMWSEFIGTQIYSSVYSCKDKVEIIVSFLNHILPMSIGGSECTMRRSVDCIVTRFSLLSSALFLVQAGVIEDVDIIIVRQRIYCSCLDYFCGLQSYPLKNGPKTNLAIKALLKFWHILYSDKKHIKYKEIEPVSREDSDIYSASEHSYDTIFTNQESVKSFDSNIFTESFTNDFFKKRKLALCLLAEEIEFLTVWSNPCNRSVFIDADKHVSIEEDKIRQWQLKFFSSTKSTNDFVKSAWEVSPILAVYMPDRIRRYEKIFEQVSNMILSKPTIVSHIPHAMKLLATVRNVSNDRKELLYLTTWAEAGHLDAINLLSRDFPPNPYVLQYAARSLLCCPIETISFYIPQLVQSLRYDSLGYIMNLLLTLVNKSQMFCHQLIWNMKTNMYLDVNMVQKSSLHKILDGLLNSIRANFSEPERIFYEREFKFVDQITEVSSKIPRNLKGDEKKLACQKALHSINIVPGCYLPCNPDGIICSIDYQSGTPLQSKSRTPYLAKFLVYKASVSDVHNIGLKLSGLEMTGSSPEHMPPCNQNSNTSEWVRTIFKAGDDVRQDILAIQTIRLLQSLCNDVGLDVFLFPYNVVGTAPFMGVIQCIPNAYSRDELGKQTNVCLYDYFITRFGNEKSAQFHKAQRSFIQSVAAYSIVNFLLQTKDRHNGNIMLDDEGHIIHIDFGFMFESSPGGNLGFEPDMKLTEEMVMIMGGKMESEPFQWFTELCVKTYLIARKHQEKFIAIVNLMLDSGLPCFRGHTIKLLKERFVPQATEREAAIYIITIIRSCFLNFRTTTYDMLQYLQNSIQY